MKKETEGLILKEQTVGDKDRLVTVLTKDRGVLRCFVRGAKNMKNSSFAATQPLCYSRLSVFRGKSSYTIDEAETIRLFYQLRKDIEQLALAQYFCELAIYAVPEETDSAEELSLLLNCLHYLPLGTKPLKLIKAVYEVRMMTGLGYPPNILYCTGCGCYEAELMYLDVIENRLICSACSQAAPGFYGLSKGAMTALRYLVLTEPKKMFSFQVSEESLEQLSQCTEAYVLERLKQPFAALDFYRQVKSN